MEKIETFQRLRYQQLLGEIEPESFFYWKIETIQN